jgi:DNA ligase-1
MTTFPTLYKKTSTGAIQFWIIGVEESNLGFELFPCIETTYGQIDTKDPQRASEYIKVGKNIGKKNETTASMQANLEAQARWQKQKKKGYVESIEAAKTDQTDALIEGGVLPMLAQGYDKHAAKINFPCFVQPKLDGIRCLAIIERGRATLWSRTRKPIYSCPHIVTELERQFANVTVTLDGELYNHDFKNDFEKIVSAVRKDEPSEASLNVQYHVYDLVSSVDFHVRTAAVNREIENTEHVRKVMTFTAIDGDELTSYYDKFKAAGYEGAMARNREGHYENKRSYNLQKVKEFQDAEFEIIGIEEGKGKLAGHAIFVCVTKKGDEFNVKLKGETSFLKRLFQERNLWEFSMLTVQFQGLTAYGLPRFPVGLRIREDA